MGQEATVRTGQGTTDWFQIGKGICHPAYLYAEYIIRNAGLGEAQAGIKIAGRNINNLRLQMTLLAESKEELKRLLIKVKKNMKATQFDSCDPMDCSLPGSSIYGIFQARILKWVAIPYSKESDRGE